MDKSRQAIVTHSPIALRGVFESSEVGSHHGRITKELSLRCYIGSVGYWRNNGLELSKDLLEHQEFLLTLEQTCDINHHIAASLIGVGQSEMLNPYRQLNLPIRGLVV